MTEPPLTTGEKALTAAITLVLLVAVCVGVVLYTAFWGRLTGAW
jgi:hypothetical protein